METPGITVATEPAEKPREEDPLVRIEKKVDRAIESIIKLQRRLESIDDVIARIANR